MEFEIWVPQQHKVSKENVPITLKETEKKDVITCFELSFCFNKGILQGKQGVIEKPHKIYLPENMWLLISVDRVAQSVVFS